jgi:hypothetical protein
MTDGAYRIAAGVYDGGDVTTVQFATIMASFALGQAAPNFQHFVKGRVAGAKLFKVSLSGDTQVTCVAAPGRSCHCHCPGQP